MGNILHSSRILTFLVTSVIYFVVYKPFFHYPPQTLEAGLLKVLPVWSLAVHVMPPNTAISELTNGQKWIISGLLISSLGDLCLIWRETLFIPGLLWFALAHVFYLKAFWSQATKTLPGATSRSLPMYCVVSLGTCAYILQNVPGAVMPYLVIIYGLLLLAVCWRATVVFEYQRTNKSLAGCLGTLAFLLSDSVIGIDKWVLPIPYAAGIVMFSYYIAQFGIAVSVS